MESHKIFGLGIAGRGRLPEPLAIIVAWTSEAARAWVMAQARTAPYRILVSRVGGGT